MFRKSMLALAACFATGAWAVQGQTLVSLNHPMPGGAQITLQLTDGTVMGQSATNNAQWYRLTPDNTGSYVNGTWTKVASLPSPYSPSAFASAVLADGRLII